MILVTGATGTNRRLVVLALLAAGVHIRAMVQDSSQAVPNSSSPTSTNRTRSMLPSPALSGASSCPPSTRASSGERPQPTRKINFGGVS
jgi:hypothetical protein